MAPHADGNGLLAGQGCHAGSNGLEIRCFREGTVRGHWRRPEVAAKLIN